MLINLWYVAAWSHELEAKPLKVKMLGQHFVLFRDENSKARCLSDICIHRGGSLGEGKCINGAVACPYHGWRFSGDGRVVHVPSETDTYLIPDRARIDSYPTEERYGMVWVFLGDLPEADRVSIPDFPEYNDPAWRKIREKWHWNTDAARVIENGIDLAHASFVHPVFGAPETASENHITRIDKDDLSATSWNVQYPPQLKGPIRQFIRRNRQPTETIPGYHLSGYIVRIQIKLNKRMSILMFDANTPIDATSTRTFATQLRTFFKLPLFDKDSRRRLRRVFREDASVIEAALPKELPDDLSHEISVKEDKFMSSFRFARRRWIYKGYKIDTGKIHQFEGRKTFAVPSPGRRENPDIKWVLDTVPLLPAKDLISDQDSP